MALHYQNVYLGSNDEGAELKLRIKAVAEEQFLSVSAFCLYAINEKLAQLEKKGNRHGTQKPLR